MKRFYFVITFLPLPRDDSFLAGQCIRTLHRFNYRHKLSCLGISFPGWTDTAIGSQLVFVCDNKQVIEQFAKDPYFQQMKVHRIFAISGITEVRESDQPEYLFVRTRKVDKYSAEGKRRALIRLKQRALARGEECYQPKSNKPTNVTAPLFHQIQLDSKSTKQAGFYLHIQREVSDNINVTGFSSYGFATRGECHGSVPLFA